MERLKDKLKRHIAAKRITQNQVAKSIGVSGGAISSWLSGTYKGDNDKLSHSVEVYLRKEESRLHILNVPTVEIENYRVIHHAMDIAADEIDIALICGESGTGKTTAVTDYIDQYGGIYIKIDANFTQYRLINLLADELGVAGKGSTAQQTERIIHALEDRDTIVAIDEADYLSDASLEYLRQVVYDAGKTGLVLCGLPRLASVIRNARNDHAQLLSRIGVYVQLNDISPEDMASIIDAAWPELKTPIRNAVIAASSIRFRKHLSPCLRTLERILKRVRRFVAQNGILEPTITDVKEVARMVMRGIEQGGTQNKKSTF